jgi:hypothetical protein
MSLVGGHFRKSTPGSARSALPPETDFVSPNAPDAALECGCNGQTTVIGRSALTQYWRQRFVEKPAGELQGLQKAADAVVVAYEVPGRIVQATLKFNAAGEIVRFQCAPP